MSNRQLWTGMTQWELMVHVDSDHHTAQYHGFAPDWPCPHCRTSLTVLTCTYTPNRFATEEQPYQAGDLCCPHCATSVARAYVRRLFLWDTQRLKAAQEDEDDDTDDDTEEP